MRHPRAQPFEERRRGARHRAGHFGPDPLARLCPGGSMRRHGPMECRIKSGNDDSGNDAPMNFPSPLPIDAALPELTAALQPRNTAVLVAPPGAGKTTRVPLVLAEEPWAGAPADKDTSQKPRRILVLEPRRLAARAAAERMAKTLGEKVGETVGLRVRFGSKVSARTRIEIVTEGVFTRLILDDPMLDGVAAVLFDEFHERSLDADLGLALARDVQQGLREDLRILVMSATIDGARVASLLGNSP